MENTVQTAFLYSIYGDFITEKQQQIIEMYHFEDFSLSEIAENLKISKQAVSEQLNRATAKLFEFEEKLHILKNRQELEEKLNHILNNIDENKLNNMDGNKAQNVVSSDATTEAETISKIVEELVEIRNRFTFFQE